MYTMCISALFISTIDSYERMSCLRQKIYNDPNAGPIEG